MAEVTNEAFDGLLTRAGLQVEGVDRERLKAMYEKFLDVLVPLHDADLDTEGVAGVFSLASGQRPTP